MISNMQHTSSFAGTATLKKLKQLSEFIIIISEKKKFFWHQLHKIQFHKAFKQ